MHLHWGWAALTALALGVGLAWWTQPAALHPSNTDDPHSHAATHHGHMQADVGPTLYRWIDARGVLNITTEHPPAGRTFTIVRIDPNRNIVPMSGEKAGDGK